MRTWRRVAASVALAGGIVLAGCSGGGEDKAAVSAVKGELTMGGSSTVAPLADGLAEAFEKANPGVSHSTDWSTSSMGTGNARFGQVKLGMVTAEIPTEFTELVQHPIARDGLGVIVHKNNSVEKLTDEQIVGIFTGKILDWKEVGGGDQKIRSVAAADTRSALQIFLKHYKLERRQMKDDTYQGSNEGAINTVVQDPTSIAYVSIAGANLAIKAGKPIKLMGLGGADPTPENVAKGSYPLIYELKFVTKGEPGTLEKAFLDFSKSADGQKVATELGFAPLAAASS